MEGVDAAQKLAVLAALAFESGIDFAGVHVEGIAAIDIEDIRYARELGFVVKHLAMARRHADGVAARVHLALVPERVLLAKGVRRDERDTGQRRRRGVHGPHRPGAGGMATASAVVADLVALARGHLPVPRPATRRLPALGVRGLVCPHYLKIPAIDSTRRVRGGCRSAEPPRESPSKP